MFRDIPVVLGSFWKAKSNEKMSDNQSTLNRFNVQIFLEVLGIKDFDVAKSSGYGTKDLGIDCTAKLSYI